MRWLVRTFGSAFVRKLGYLAAAAALAALLALVRAGADWVYAVYGR